MNYPQSGPAASGDKKATLMGMFLFEKSHQLAKNVTEMLKIHSIAESAI